MERLTAELATAKEKAARSKAALQDSLSTDDDVTAAKATMKQAAGEVAELEADLAHAQEALRIAERELDEATKRVERAALDEAMQTLLSAMQMVERAFPAAESAADALNVALKGVTDCSNGNTLLRLELDKIRGAYKRYVMKTHRALWPEGKAHVSAIEDKPFSHFLPDLETLPMPAQPDEGST